MAKAIRRASRSFGLGEPERCQDERRRFMTENSDAQEQGVRGWHDSICGDERVWADLAAWAGRQQA